MNIDELKLILQTIHDAGVGAKPMAEMWLAIQLIEVVLPWLWLLILVWAAYRLLHYLITARTTARDAAREFTSKISMWHEGENRIHAYLRERFKPCVYFNATDAEKAIRELEETKGAKR